MNYHDPNKPKQVEDRFENKTAVPEGASATVETTEEIRITTPVEISGMGHRMKRKEDPRFIQGKGNYIDDFKLPGMLYMDIVRSPYAHARIKEIDASAALAMDGVLAVITGKDLEAHGLHWMPTLMSDTQMVLPTDKVVYYSQEVACVIATASPSGRAGARSCPSAAPAHR
jgi:CO/xanthine dehydrogenase Mo-binding subunit